jgi:hypothetical protein
MWCEQMRKYTQKFELETVVKEGDFGVLRGGRRKTLQGSDLNWVSEGGKIEYLTGSKTQVLH